jgi:hypothetical protein
LSEGGERKGERELEEEKSGTEAKGEEWKVALRQRVTNPFSDEKILLALNNY